MEGATYSEELLQYARRNTRLQGDQEEKDEEKKDTVEARGTSCHRHKNGICVQNSCSGFCPTTYLVTLINSLNFSEPPFPHLL